MKARRLKTGNHGSLFAPLLALSYRSRLIANAQFSKQQTNKAASRFRSFEL